MSRPTWWGIWVSLGTLLPGDFPKYVVWMIPVSPLGIWARNNVKGAAFPDPWKRWEFPKDDPACFLFLLIPKQDEPGEGEAGCPASGSGV